MLARDERRFWILWYVRSRRAVLGLGGAFLAYIIPLCMTCGTRTCCTTRMESWLGRRTLDEQRLCDGRTIVYASCRLYGLVAFLYKQSIERIELANGVVSDPLVLYSQKPSISLQCLSPGFIAAALVLWTRIKCFGCQSE